MLCAALLWVHQSRADGAADDLGEVRVHLVGQAYTHEFAELLREWLLLQQLRAQVRAQPSLSLDDLVRDDDSSSVRVWLTLRSSEQARLYFADQHGRRFHVRDVPLDDALDELGREKVAQVVLASVLAFVDRSLPETPLDSVKQALAEAPADPIAPETATPAAVATVGDTGTAPAPVPTVRSADARQRATWWALGVRYHVLYRGPEGWAHGPGLDLEVWPVLQQLGVGFVLGGRYEWPHTASSANLDVRVQTTALRVAAVLATLVSGRPRWTLSLGAGWDWYGFEPESTSSTVSVGAGATDSRPVTSAAFGFAAALGPLRLDLGLGADVPLAKTHYDIRVAGEKQPELTPWPVQPRASIGVAWQ